MRFLLMVCVVLGLALLPSMANAAGQVPDATLTQVGLVGMQPMTDVQGINIRGNGFAMVSGFSFANSVPGTPYSKFQGSPAVVVGTTGAFGFAGTSFAFAGGGSVAYAK